jgi:Fe-S-cluster containining protein
VLDLALAAFIEHFTRLREDRQGLALAERPDGACVFLDGNPAVCRIQSVKPQQCRDFPFTWRYEDLERICPASRDRGQTEQPA